MIPGQLFSYLILSFWISKTSLNRRDGLALSRRRIGASGLYCSGVRSRSQLFREGYLLHLSWLWKKIFWFLFLKIRFTNPWPNIKRCFIFTFDQVPTVFPLWQILMLSFFLLWQENIKKETMLSSAALKTKVSAPDWSHKNDLRGWRHGACGCLLELRGKIDDASLQNGLKKWQTNTQEMESTPRSQKIWNEETPVFWWRAIPSSKGCNRLKTARQSIGAPIVDAGDATRWLNSIAFREKSRSWPWKLVAEKLWGPVEKSMAKGLSAAQQLGWLTLSEKELQPVGQLAK